jgi:phosphotransferase system  glucose/maltose/N-acetylglucosamine-specific IIC component
MSAALMGLMVLMLVALVAVMVWPWVRRTVVRSSGRLVHDVRRNVAEREEVERRG